MKKVETKVDKASDIIPDYRNVFVVSALSMSWQLAVIVLGPIIGGYELDNHLKTTPWLLLAGIVLAFSGSLVVIINALKLANQKVSKDGK